MRRYEQIYILRPSLSEDEIAQVVQNTNQLILDDDGAIIYQNNWGMRKLAYQIKKEMQGYYVLCDFAASPEVVFEIERKFRIDDSVLKYLTVKLADSITPEEIENAKSEAETKAVVPDSDESDEEKPSLSEIDRKKKARDAETDEDQESEEEDDTENAS